MIIREQKPYNTLILNMMDKLPNINKWRRMFLLETFILFLSIRGRINFLQLARYGRNEEQRYRQHFEKRYDFLSFNKELTIKPIYHESHCLFYGFADYTRTVVPAGIDDAA